MEQNVEGQRKAIQGHSKPSDESSMWRTGNVIWGHDDRFGGSSWGHDDRVESPPAEPLQPALVDEKTERKRRLRSKRPDQQIYVPRGRRGPAEEQNDETRTSETRPGRGRSGQSSKGRGRASVERHVPKARRESSETLSDNSSKSPEEQMNDTATPAIKTPPRKGKSTEGHSDHDYPSMSKTPTKRVKSKRRDSHGTEEQLDSHPAATHKTSQHTGRGRTTDNETTKIHSESSDTVKINEKEHLPKKSNENSVLSGDLNVPSFEAAITNISQNVALANPSDTKDLSLPEACSPMQDLTEEKHREMTITSVHHCAAGSSITETEIQAKSDNFLMGPTQDMDTCYDKTLEREKSFTEKLETENTLHIKYTESCAYDINKVIISACELNSDHDNSVDHSGGESLATDAQISDGVPKWAAADTHSTQSNIASNPANVSREENFVLDTEGTLQDEPSYNLPKRRKSDDLQEQLNNYNGDTKTTNENMTDSLTPTDGDINECKRENNKNGDRDLHENTVEHVDKCGVSDVCDLNVSQFTHEKSDAQDVSMGTSISVINASEEDLPTESVLDINFSTQAINNEILLTEQNEHCEKNLSVENADIQAIIQQEYVTLMQLQEQNNIAMETLQKNVTTESQKHSVTMETGEEEDSWDAMFNDDGEALDPKILDELTEKVGKVKVQKTQFDYLEFQPADPDLDDESYGHLIEIYDFPSDLITRDIIAAFRSFQDKGFDLKWVDDTHCIGIFSSKIAAQSALSSSNPLLKVRPIAAASRQTKLKAKKCATFLEPYKPRPVTTAAVARNLVTNALGLTSRVPKEKREEERRKLREAKAKKKEALQHKNDAWEGKIGRCAMDEV